MPELPEVETVVRTLRPDLVGRTITHAENHPALVGQTFLKVERRAKYIVCQLTDLYLLVHLKMTGRLYVIAEEEQNPDDKWVRVRWSLSDGQQLRFSDARKFGRVWVTNDPLTVTAKLGVEPLEDGFTLDGLRAMLAKTSRHVKAFLLDQAHIAGIGNIYADEALFKANVLPIRPANTLTATESALLYDAIREVLQAGIQHEGASIQWYRKPDGKQGEAQNHFYAYGRNGLPCLVCGTPLHKTRVAQRGTHFCPHCQK